ncbi:MAG TPA: MFS transporter [Rubrivivax sp.]|nr:MFS transporter [Rubrivivax sp.]
MALNPALTGASAAGFLIVPLLAGGIARFGLGPGVALTAGTVAVPLLLLIAFNLVEPTAPPPAAPAGTPASSRLRLDRPLALLCALFGIGWLAQVALLAQQLPLLVPKVGPGVATLAVAVTTASSLLGRLGLASFIDRVDHRRATAAGFGVQALGSGMMAGSDEAVVVIAGCALVGVSVGNVITLPALFAQREFAPPHYGAVITRIWSIGQVMYAFGPIGAGLLLGASGGSTLPLLACMGCQGLAAALCFVRPLARRR